MVHQLNHQTRLFRIKYSEETNQIGFKEIKVYPFLCKIERKPSSEAGIVVLCHKLLIKTNLLRKLSLHYDLSGGYTSTLIFHAMNR